MIRMHSYLITQLATERQASLHADGARHRLAAQARTARRAAARTGPARRATRLLHPAAWRRARVPA
jgi:hypothetical protein